MFYCSGVQAGSSKQNPLRETDCGHVCALEKWELGFNENGEPHCVCVRPQETDGTEGMPAGQTPPARQSSSISPALKTSKQNVTVNVCSGEREGVNSGRKWLWCRLSADRPAEKKMLCQTGWRTGFQELRFNMQRGNIFTFHFWENLSLPQLQP